MQQLYVAELNDNGIEVLHEVSQEELDELKTSYPNFKAFHRMTELKDIVVENGMDFKEWMQKDNIEKCYFNHIPTEKLVQTSNKLAFNFGASVGTFLYTEEKLLKKYKPGMEIELEKLERSFYDDNIEYRFWVRFRNYVVHYALPYTGLEADGANGIQIVCKKKHLLEFEQWNQVRNDIENMDENVNLPIMVEKMNVLIDALYIHSFHAKLTGSRFGKHILDRAPASAAGKHPLQGWQQTNRRYAQTFPRRCTDNPAAAAPDRRRRACSRCSG